MKSAKCVQIAKGTIEYSLEGDGAPVLVLHGGHSSCRETFGRGALLKAGFAVLTPSRPGYGQTSVSVGKTAADAADSMISLLDALQIDKVAVIAISAGGLTGLHLAATYPERVSKLVLESAVTQTWLSPDDATYKIARKLFHPRTERLTWGMLKRLVRLFPRFVFRQMAPSFSTLPMKEVMRTLSEEDLALFQQMIERQSSGAGFMLDLDHHIEAGVIDTITVPTLIVHSPHDNAVPFAHARHAHQRIPQSELLQANTWGHLIWLGADAQRIKAKINAFLLD
ncbi:MAG: alpha/beta fold hydrolase [Ardenticatenaceae bacterium]